MVDYWRGLTKTIEQWQEPVQSRAVSTSTCVAFYLPEPNWAKQPQWLLLFLSCAGDLMPQPQDWVSYSRVFWLPRWNIKYIGDVSRQNHFNLCIPLSNCMYFTWTSSSGPRLWVQTQYVCWTFGIVKLLNTRAFVVIPVYELADEI